MRTGSNTNGGDASRVGKRFSYYLVEFVSFLSDAGRVAPIRACDWSERFLQRVSDYLKCNKIGRAFNAYFERPNLTGRDCSNTYLRTR